MLAEKTYILDETDLYKIIGVDENTDLEVINKTYRGLAKQFHPDILKFKDEKENDKAKAIFSKITSAYNILKDSEKRKSYDYERRLKKEYEKTMQNGFTFSNNLNNVRPNSGMSVRINNDAPAASEEEKQKLKNAQTDRLFNLSMEKFSNGDIDGAILELQTAITINPKISKYHSSLGMMMKEKGWQSYAIAHFKKALNIDPKDKLALKYIDILQAEKAETEKAENKNTNKNTKNKVEKKSGFFDIIARFFGKLFKKN